MSLSIPDRRVSWRGEGESPRLLTGIAARLTLLRSKGRHADVREGRVAAMTLRSVDEIAVRESGATRQRIQAERAAGSAAPASLRNAAGANATNWRRLVAK
jgi:hypothetical protein